MIDEADTREMVRLLGEVAVAGASLCEKRGALMRGMSRLVEADAWLWVRMGRCAEGELPTFSVLQNDGFSEQRFDDFMKAQEHPDMGRLMAPFLAEYAAKGCHLTRLRQQIDPNGAFESSDVHELWRQADVGPLMLSIKPAGQGETSIICLYRRFARDLFTPRHARLAHILISEVPWIHEEGPDRAESGVLRGLSPRLNTVLNLLLQGRDRKTIASHVGISIHTVHDYVKELYRRFGVHSQSELIRRFVDGDGGDLA